MRKLIRNITVFSASVLLLLPGIVLAAGGGEVAPLVIVADTRRLTGIMAWWANLYNESHLQFTLLTVVLIPVIGLIFGLLADVVMTRIGLDLKSRELAEH
jgi:hypothetical protein